MSQAELPPFDVSHLWMEQVMVLKAPEGQYGRLIAMYPIGPDGGPDEFSGRLPVFNGQATVLGVAPNGAQVSVPITFLIPAVDPLTAAQKFHECATKAMEEFRSNTFRAALANSGKIQ